MPGRGEELVIAQNYIKKRVSEEELYRLCDKCPAPQNSSGVSVFYFVFSVLYVGTVLYYSNSIKHYSD